MLSTNNILSSFKLASMRHKLVTIRGCKEAKYLAIQDKYYCSEMLQYTINTITAKLCKT